MLSTNIAKVCLIFLKKIFFLISRKKFFLRNAFVSVEVNEILDPMLINSSWDNGLLFNATMHFRKGAVKNPLDVYTQLVKYIIEKNGQQVGNSGLYLSTNQKSPFSSCFKVFLKFF